MNTALITRLKFLAGFNLLWNSKSGEVHFTGGRCCSSDHINQISPEHLHYLTGHYYWTGVIWQLVVDRWDPATDPGLQQVRYSNCAHCTPERVIANRRAA